MARRRRQQGAEPQGEGVPRRRQQVLLVHARRPAVVAAQPHVPVVKMHLDVVPLHQPVDVRCPVQLRGAVVARAHLHRRGAAVRRRVQAEPAGVAECHPPDVRPPAALHGGNVRHVQLLHAALVHADVRRRLAVRVALEGPAPVPRDVAQGPPGAEHDAHPGKGREVAPGVYLVVENHVA
uniref:Uncharacterized protein n=1 Tax=Zea mays TaxID=4577 RepID=B8A1K6_MAIZE|nr:unknown [Zea mays]